MHEDNLRVENEFRERLIELQRDVKEKEAGIRKLAMEKEQ
jgi:hypothetical protein